MKFTTIVFMVIMTFFIGCDYDSNGVEVSSDSSITPQPNVTNESVRPPKPPSL